MIKRNYALLLGWLVALLLVSSAVAMSSTAGGGWLCCSPAEYRTTTVIPCPPPLYGDCTGTCQTRSGLFSGGCVYTANPFKTCTDTTIYVPHDCAVYTCQSNGQGTCPCPPAGEPLPDRTWRIDNVMVNTCTGSSC